MDLRNDLLPPAVFPEQRMMLTREAAEALDFIMPLSPEYPGIETWFRYKVVPGIYDGSRFLYRVERQGRLVGLGIAKRADGERKICTVRIAPEYAGKGFGLRIFDSLLSWVDTDQPHLTVSEQKLPQFERIFDYYKFKLSSRKHGLYLPTRAELIYNEN